MIRGYSALWPEMISDLLAKRENGLEYTGLTDYFRLLDEYLDHQLDPSAESSLDDYVDPPVTSPDIEEKTSEGNDIPNVERTSDQKTEVDETHESIIDNVIDTGDDANLRAGLETSTVGVLEIKNPVASSEHNEKVPPKEASYNTYWWIGIAVALVVVVALVAIIARKRHNHRKQLERQRRDNSRA